ncbi:concanavalin A-like lectin protein kinase family protein [Actinidia rufa]|uniref:non-specific serine/threonine protein kinase n=1 Tax=Actinidia rufa TaxID=165716 RepID=A0A7J0E038_9ERIC|nr:concanavalin A-like lectin protein kinase family protein [Actinidia rufa]
MKHHRQPPLLLLSLLPTILSLQPLLAFEFLFNGFEPSNISLYGIAKIESKIISLTNQTSFSIGRALYSSKIQTKDPNSSLVLPFSTSFIFFHGSKQGDSARPWHSLPICALQRHPKRATASQNLGFLNRTNDQDPQNPVFGIEFDVFENEEFSDINSNHVGINLNSLTSTFSHEAGYYTGNENESFRGLELNNGKNYQAWIDYADFNINVTMALAGMERPIRPLMNFPLNLSQVLGEEMYVGFTAATGALVQSHRILSWSFSHTNFSLSEALVTTDLPSFELPGRSIFRSKWFIAGMTIGVCCSSRRYGAPAPNRIENGVRTRPHEPFEYRQREAGKEAEVKEEVITEVLEKDGGGHKREVALLGAFKCDQEGHIKRDCPKYKAQDQSSDTAATAVMADDDEIKVLLAASMMIESQIGFEASGGILRVSKGNKEMLWRKKTRGLYQLEGSVQTGGATVRHGSSGISKKNGQGKQQLHRGTQSKRRVQDVHREAQRKETKSILRSCTAKGAVTPKRVSFALDLISGGVLSSCAHKGGEMEPRQLANFEHNRVFVVFVACSVFALLWVRRNKRGEEIEEWELEYWPHRIPYREIDVATKGFSEENVIGIGGNGKVYKAVLAKGAEVAVKVISHDNSEGMREFLAEVSSLGRLKHRNLVGLRGWCKKEKGSLILVYDYIENGSLDKRVFDCDERKLLSWEERIRILKNVASGVLYLHEEWEVKVLHRDIKASNVLLDKEMSARLGDFGLARMHGHGQAASTTRVIGTVGYLAPEVVKTGRATTQTDVFSFGILILEVICGRRPIEGGKTPLVDWGWELLGRGVLGHALDEKLRRAQGGPNEEEVERVLHLGLLCAHPDPRARPTIRQVVKVLGGKNEAEGPESEGMDVYLLEKMKAREMWPKYKQNLGHGPHPTFDQIRQAVSSSMSLSWSDAIVEGR